MYIAVVMFSWSQLKFNYVLSYVAVCISWKSQVLFTESEINVFCAHEAYLLMFCSSNVLVRSVNDF